MYLTVEVEQEADGRFLAGVTDLPGVIAYGTTDNEVVARALALRALALRALALRVLVDRIENGEPTPSLPSLDFRTA